MRYQIVISATLLIFTLLLNACENAPKNPEAIQQPQSILWNSPNCMVACWYGLKPGISSESDVEAFFQEHLLSSSDLFSGQQDEFNWYTGSVQIYDDAYYVRARVFDNLLFSIWLQGPFNLTLEQVITNVGEPQLFEVGVLAYGPESSLLEGHIFLHYPEMGYTFRTYHWGGNVDDNSLEICLKPDDIVYDFFVYERLPVSEFIPEDQNIRNYSPNLISKEWEGYNCFNQAW